VVQILSAIIPESLKRDGDLERKSGALEGYYL